MFTQDRQSISWASSKVSFVSADLPKELKANLLCKGNAPTNEVTGRCSTGEGTELTIGGVNMYFWTVQTTSCCSAHSKILTKVLVQVKSFRGSVSSRVQQKEDSGCKRRKKRTKNETRKPCGFQVKQCLCPRTQCGADKSYNAPERRGEPRPSCPERFQRFPPRRQQPRRRLNVHCSEHECGCMQSDCSATSKMSPTCFVM